MEVLRIDLADPRPEYIDHAADVIRRGGAVIVPTDTVYGICANALDAHAVTHVFNIKRRAFSKPLPVFIHDIGVLRKFVYLDKKRERVLKEVWPGAVTVVLAKRPLLPSVLTGRKNNVGVRIPDSIVVLELLERLGGPITGTSANISGEEPSGKIEEILKRFKKSEPKPDLILYAGDLPDSPPSTVLDLTGPKPQILRMGPVTREQLTGFLEA